MGNHSVEDSDMDKETSVKRYKIRNNDMVRDMNK